jgi:hypothetical protein
MTSKRRLLLRIVFWLAAGALLAAAGFVFWLALFFDSNSLRPRLAQWVADTYGRTLDIGELHWTPFLPSRVVANKVTLGGKRGEAPLLTAGSLKLDVSLIALLANRLDVQGIELSAADVHIARGADGKWNFDDLIPRGPSRFKSTRIDQLAIVESTVRIHDAASNRSVELIRANVALRPVAAGERAGWKLKSRWKLDTGLSGEVDAGGRLSFQRAEEAFEIGEAQIKAAVDLESKRRVTMDAKLASFSLTKQAAQGLTAGFELSGDDKRIAAATLLAPSVPLSLGKVPLQLDWDTPAKWSGRIAAVLEVGAKDEPWRLSALKATAVNPDLPLKVELDGSANVDTATRRAGVNKAKLTVGMHRPAGKLHTLSGELNATILANESPDGLSVEATLNGALDREPASVALRYPVAPGSLIGLNAKLQTLDLSQWQSTAVKSKQRTSVDLDLAPLRALPLKGVVTIGTMKSGATIARNVRIEVE